MSMTRTSNYRTQLDHFEPQETTDPAAQRRLRGQLEQIDYTAFAANREALARAVKETGAVQFQKLAVAAAQARAQWVAEALEMTDTGREPSASEIARLTQLRQAFEELTEAYEALRRMVERGYLTYGSAG
jgi:hypothetical protein